VLYAVVFGIAQHSTGHAPVARGVLVQNGGSYFTRT
jgi:hypothetical protein